MPEAKLLETVTERWVVAELDTGDSVALWDSVVRAESDNTQIVMGLSSEFIFAGVIAGSAESDAGTLNPGNVLMLRHLGTTPARRQVFSARELAQKFRDVGRDDLADTLGDVIEQQRKKRFWGLLRPTNISVAVPLRDDVEAIRQTYAASEPLIRIKRSVDDIDELPQAVAAAFLESAHRADVTTVAALLDPTPFRASARQGRLQADRTAIAAVLVEQEWARQYRADRLFTTEDPLRFIFLAGQTPYRINLAVFDNSVFVESIGPITVPNLSPRPEESP